MDTNYFDSDEFQSHRQKILDTLSALPHVTDIEGWGESSTLVVGGLTYISFSSDSRYLMVVSSTGRGVFDLESLQQVAQDYETEGDWLNENLLTCQGIGPIKDEQLQLTGIGGGGMPLLSGNGDSIYLAAPLFPCYDVVYQPNYQHCLLEGHNKNCSIIYRGFVEYCGFSWDGNTLIVVDEDIHIWRRLK